MKDSTAVIIVVLVVVLGVCLFYTKVARYESIYSFHGFESETYLLKLDVGYENPEIIFPDWVSDDMKENWRFTIVVDSVSDDVGVLATSTDFSGFPYQGTFVVEVTAKNVAIVQLTMVPKDSHLVWVEEIAYWKPSWWE